MPLYFGGKRISSIGITNGIGLDTSDADMTPADGQNGKIYYANGKRYVGTGRCFEFAQYGIKITQLIQDENGNDKYGVKIELDKVPNLILISSTDSGDTIIQTKHLVNLSEGTSVLIGQNITANGEMFALYNTNYLFIYFSEIENKKTKLRFFVGKDNEI